MEIFKLHYSLSVFLLPFLLTHLMTSASVNPSHNCTLVTGNGTKLIPEDQMPYALIWIKFSFKLNHFKNAEYVCATARFTQNPISYDYRLQYIKGNIDTCYVKVFYEYRSTFDPNATDSCGK